MTEPSTLKNILDAAKREFLEKGFARASLRKIVRDAGVTTGAFYGYFENKEQLFDALVEEAATAIMKEYLKAQESFEQLPAAEQPNFLGKISGSCLEWMTDYVYDHFDAVKLLICSAGGTKYEDFVHRMCEIEVNATHKFLDVLKSLGHPIKEIDPSLEHILVSGMFSAFFEMVVHDMPRQQAPGFVKELSAFYTAGWKNIMGL